MHKNGVTDAAPSISGAICAAASIQLLQVGNYTITKKKGIHRKSPASPEMCDDHTSPGHYTVLLGHQQPSIPKVLVLQSRPKP